MSRWTRALFPLLIAPGNISLPLGGRDCCSGRRQRHSRTISAAVLAAQQVPCRLRINVFFFPKRVCTTGCFSFAVRARPISSDGHRAKGRAVLPPPGLGFQALRARRASVLGRPQSSFFLPEVLRANSMLSLPLTLEMLFLPFHFGVARHWQEGRGSLSAQVQVPGVRICRQAVLLFVPCCADRRVELERRPM